MSLLYLICATIGGSVLVIQFAMTLLGLSDDGHMAHGDTGGEHGGHNGTTSTANFLQNMSRTLPPMLQVMRDIAGVELPDSLLKAADDGAADEHASESNGKSAQASKTE